MGHTSDTHLSEHIDRLTSMINNMMQTGCAASVGPMETDAEPTLVPCALAGPNSGAQSETHDDMPDRAVAPLTMSPLLLSSGIKAAFPSLLPELMAEALAATEAPHEIRQFAAALYDGSVAQCRTESSVPAGGSFTSLTHIFACGWMQCT